MQPTFSLAHLTVLGCTPPELTYIAARAGYDYVSPRFIMTGSSNESGNYDPSRDRGLYQQTRKALSETGLKVHDIELARINDSFDPASLKPTLEVAAEFGAAHLLSSIWTPDRSLAIERFAELCDTARPYGINVCLEFVSWADLYDLRETLDVVNTVDRPNARIVVDLLHAHCSRVPPAELSAVPPELFGFVHLCDGPAEIPSAQEQLIFNGRAQRLYVGEGGVDVLGYLNQMPAVPYSIEIPHLARVKELGPAEYASRCLATAKEFLAQHSFTTPARASTQTLPAAS